MDTNHQKVKELENSIGNFIKYWGFKSIHGKIWLYVFLKQRAVSSKELKEHFEISKALLSMTLSDLKEYDVLYDCGKGPFGAELMEANPDIFDAIINVIRNREKLLIEDINKNITDLRKMNSNELLALDIDKNRLKTLNNLVKSGKKTINGFLKLENLSLSYWKNFYKN